MNNIKEIMTRDVAFTTPDASLVEVAKMMVECDCGEIPLVNNKEEKKVVGVLTDRDIVCRSLGQGKDPCNMSAKDCMSSSIVTVTEENSIDDCLSLMEENRIRRIPVVDNSKSLCGIVAQADILQSGRTERSAEVVEKISRPTDSPSQTTH